MAAKVVFYDPLNNVTEIKMDEHTFGFGGPGDGFCYGHQSFKCLENLSPEEEREIDEAEWLN